MTRTRWLFVTSLLLLTLGGSQLRAGPAEETATVDSAVEVVKSFSEIPLTCIPPALLHDARGVAIIPHVVKAGFLIDRRFGRGVVLIRQPDGSWSNPEFVTLDGGGFGLQAGIQSTDLVLVFKTRHSVNRMLEGKLTLGSDVSVAAGPLGREAEMGTDGRLLPEVCSYSRSRGLFVGASLEGVRLQVDGRANEAFYGVHDCRPEDVLGWHGAAFPAVEALKGELVRVGGGVMVVPPVIVPPPPPVIGPPVVPPMGSPPVIVVPTPPRP
jgi:lipid-binding SYLF domain-containing protein